jgi:hypothetical protein
MLTRSAADRSSGGRLFFDEFDDAEEVNKAGDFVH